MLTGSAPISKTVIDFLKIACGCPILEGCNDFQLIIINNKFNLDG